MIQNLFEKILKGGFKPEIKTRNYKDPFVNFFIVVINFVFSVIHFTLWLTTTIISFVFLFVAAIPLFILYGPSIFKKNDIDISRKLEKQNLSKEQEEQLRLKARQEVQKNKLLLRQESKKIRRKYKEDLKKTFEKSINNTVEQKILEAKHNQDLNNVEEINKQNKKQTSQEFLRESLAVINATSTKDKIPNLKEKPSDKKFWEEIKKLEALENKVQTKLNNNETNSENSQLDQSNSNDFFENSLNNTVEQTLILKEKIKKEAELEKLRLAEKAKRITEEFNEKKTTKPRKGFNLSND